MVKTSMWRLRRSLCKVEAFRAIASAAKRAGDIRLGLPALVVEDEQIPLSDASFDAITFINSVKHILMETAVSPIGN